MKADYKYLLRLHWLAIVAGCGQLMQPCGQPTYSLAGQAGYSQLAREREREREKRNEAILLLVMIVMSGCQ